MPAQIDKENTGLDALREHVRARFALVHRKLDALSVGFERVQELQQQLLSSIINIHNARFPFDMATLPDDVLRAIFEAVIASAGHWTSDDVDVMFHRAQSPYRLSAVCRRWRSIVLDSPTLWNYIPVHPLLNLPFRLQHYPDELRSRLECSRQAPLDIIVSWSMEPSLGEVHHTILSQLASYHKRWRRFMFIGPDNLLLPEEVLRIFCLPTPSLEELFITLPSYILTARPAGDLTRFFPDCRSLRRFDCLLSDVLWRTPSSTSATSALTHLSFAVCDTPVSLLWAMLAEVAGSLVFLRVTGGPLLTTPMRRDTPSLKTITFPLLRTLEGRSGFDLTPVSWSGTIVAPRLEALVLKEVDLNNLSDFLAVTARGVTSLEIEDGRNMGIDISGISWLRPLVHVRKLVFRDFQLQPDDWDIMSRPLDATPAQSPSWMFPELHTLVFRDIEQPAETWTGHLAEVMANRRHAAEEDGAPTRIACVEFDHCNGVGSVVFEFQGFSIPVKY